MLKILIKLHMPLATVALLLPTQLAHAQFVQSAYSSAAIANVASIEPGVSFASSNPAILGFLPSGKLATYVFEETDHTIDRAFVDEIPNFSFHIRLTKRFVLGLARSENNLPSQATAIRVHTRNDPILIHPLHTFVFSFQNDWSAGLGFRISEKTGVGVSLSHIKHTITPFPLGFQIGRSYQILDLGLTHRRERITIGVQFNNLVKNSLGKQFDQPLRLVFAPDSAIVWQTDHFPGVSFTPKTSVSAGMSWAIGSHWQLLGDISSRREFALGMRWRVVAGFYLAAGFGSQYDQIFDDEKVSFMSLGSELRIKGQSASVTWVIPTSSGTNEFPLLPYGQYELRQQTQHALLIGFAFSL